MERGRGTTIAAIVMAGLLMRPTGTQISENSTAANRSTSRGAIKEVSGDGPWKASCRYWQQERTLGEEKTAPAEEAMTADAHDNKASINISITAKKEDVPDCEGASERWGAPADLTRVPNVRSLVALVPDPVHSHFATQFDRHLDMLLAASADNNYLISYSWLPWKISQEKPAGNQPDEAGGKDSEDQPGLLIFNKRTPKGPEDNEAGGAKPTLYIFLVGEMPADGVNSKQLERALAYQSELRAAFHEQFSRVDASCHLGIIGPSFSGSASSLNETIRAAYKEPTADEVKPDCTSQPRPDVVLGVSIAGATQTKTAAYELNDRNARPQIHNRPQRYISFASSQTEGALLSQLRESGYGRGENLAVLTEDATVFGRGDKDASGRGDKDASEEVHIFFPREISLLRNSYKSDTGSSTGEAAPPTPYLHLSTRDPSARDTIPHYSKETSPLSQEAQLMAISHALQQHRTAFVYVNASNVLDELFLAQFLHRSNPDVRIVHKADLLFDREADNASYVGSFSVDPYQLSWPAHSPEIKRSERVFANSESIAYYNAASYMVWKLRGPETVPNVAEVRPGQDGKPAQSVDAPVLFSYGGKPSDDGGVRPSLWLTTVGNDAYYPVAVLPNDSGMTPLPQAKSNLKITVNPSHLWQALCAFIMIVCLIHIFALLSARYSSPQTCDLDLLENDQRHRRALFILCGGVVLFLLSVVLTLPFLRYLNLRPLHVSPINNTLALGTLFCGISAGLLAWWKTRRFLSSEGEGPNSLFNLSESSVCTTLYWLTFAGGAVLAALWFWLCWRDEQRLGMFFSYRCLHPDSGVSPVGPVLLLLWGWYFWSVTQTRRLRFSMKTRPRLPNARKISAHSTDSSVGSPDLLFVSDHRLEDGLVKDLTCLMISRRLAQKVFPGASANSKMPDVLLIVSILLLAVLWFWICPIKALDHFGWWPKIAMTTPYEFFIGALLVPFVVLILCASARMFLVWTDLRSQILEMLEMRPPRFAFSRLKDVSWMSMLREGDMLKRRRDMARSAESLRQLASDPVIQACAPNLAQLVKDLEADIKEAQDHIDASDQNPVAWSSSPGKTASAWKEQIECKYAQCAEVLLQNLLIPHWVAERHTCVQARTSEVDPGLSVPAATLLRAEEFLALRYLALIRAVMVQIRHLMVFITVGFVLVMLASNAYPFQPRQEIDVVLTGMLLAFGIGIVMVFAQMHRDALLSRITNTKANELGIDFYLRIAAFGALPVLTWLATQYPDIGGTLYKFIRPGIDVMK